jgi:hypothetical protein
MNIVDLQEKLRTIAQMEQIGLNVYFLLKTRENENILKRANIIEDVKTNMINSYKNSLMEIAQNEDICLINLSDADDRNNAIYLYNLDKQPTIFNFFETIKNTEQPDYFNFNNDNLSDLEGYYIFIGDNETNVLLYRKQMPINLFKRGKIYLVKGHNTQFESINEEFLRIDAKIDILEIQNTIIINNISILERHYEFHDIIETEAKTSLDNIANLNILSNIEVLQERVTDTTFARKLSKISTTSPVFNLPAAHILQFVTNHTLLSREFKYNEDKSQILLDTKKSQNFFIKLMNDDFLHSELTNYDYLTPAKDRLQAEE